MVNECHLAVTGHDYRSAGFYGRYAG
jgi:hypothetical protein